MRMLPRKRVLGFLLLSLTVLFVPLAAFGQDYKAPVSKLDLNEGDTVVFLGDSITHQCLYTQYVEDYFYTRFPKLNVRFHNAGVGGAKARDALDRFDRDVAAYKPKYVTVLLGMNDGTYIPYDDKTFQTYKADMTELLGKIRGIGATPILMTPTMYDSRAARLKGGNLDAIAPRLELYNSTLAYYGAWLREVAVETGAGFVDMYSPLNNLTLQARKEDSKFTMIADAVHPGPAGQLVMGFAILEDLSFPRPVSNIRVTLESDKSAKVAGPGGKATNVQATGGGVEFTWAADSLPWVLPPETAVGAKLLRSGHRMSREALEVHGLAPGKYELTIDGTSVGVFPSDRLAAHIELQENNKTPQYQQALQVAELNKQRNDKAVRPLRNEWSQMQMFYRLQRQAKADPNNADTAKKLEDQTKKVDGLEERIAKHEQTAKELDQQIRAAAQPKPRHYRLTRVGDAKVSGRVIFNGKPVGGGEVAFFGPQGEVTRGKTDDEGRFTLGSGRAGVYNVAITGRSIPAKYGAADVTPLRAEIRGSQINEFQFVLTD